jgi:hypothetical protein
VENTTGNQRPIKTWMTMKQRLSERYWRTMEDTGKATSIPSTDKY